MKFTIRFAGLWPLGLHPAFYVRYMLETREFDGYTSNVHFFYTQLKQTIMG